jgi:hypothetical protein
VTTAEEHDPYRLSRPDPRGLVIGDDTVKPVHAHLNSHYGDPIWSLAALRDSPAAMRLTITWANCPVVFHDQLRLAVWNLINGALRPAFVSGRGSMRTKVSASTITSIVGRWFLLATWLQARGIDDLADCDTTTLHDYGMHLLFGPTRGRDTARNTLLALTRLWAFDEVSAAPCGIGQPPWESGRIDDYLPDRTPTGPENATPPLAENTIAPLLMWAMRLVDDLAADVIAAHTECRRLEDAIPPVASAGGGEALRAYLDWLIDTHGPLPTTMYKDRIMLASNYICGRTGASRAQLSTSRRRRARLLATAASRERGCPLQVPVTGRIAGKPWRDAMDFYETRVLWRHLGTAAFVVCAYLTGMRPAEVLSLKAGCCPSPDPADDGGVARHQIHGRQYKTAVDDDGNHLSDGAERVVPWVAIGPVVNAIRVLETMVPPDSLLFDVRAHDSNRRASLTGAIVGSTMRTRITDFVAWANAEAARHQLIHETIHPDPNGPIATARFRRTLAWHIARRPNGHVALAIQYGHLQSAVVAGRYASRVIDGIHDLIDIETVRAVADTLADLRDDIASGAGVSGPAARDVIKTAASAPRFNGSAINATTARRLIANQDLMIYDNPHALLLCRYKPDRAQCHRDRPSDTPLLSSCSPSCQNIARTDQQAAQMRTRADLLEQQAALTPQPVADRLHANAARMRSHADAHDSTRITATNDRNPHSEDTP